MKLAIVTLILLTLAIAAPPLYTYWAESRRQQQIHEIKQQARQPTGETFESVLALLEGEAPPSLVILYTGGTQSHLEPCGCYQEQSGGLPRRAYLVSEIRRQGIPTLVVDAGDIFDGTEDIDFHRCQLNLKAMFAMGYDAVALSQNDLNYGDAYLIEQSAAASVPFLGVNHSYAQPSILQTIGELSIAVVSASTVREFPNTNMVIALGTSNSTEYPNIYVIISSEEVEPTPQMNAPIWIVSTRVAQTLGFFAIWLNAAGE